MIQATYTQPSAAFRLQESLRATFGAHGLTGIDISVPGQVTVTVPDSVPRGLLGHKGVEQATLSAPEQRQARYDDYLAQFRTNAKQALANWNTLNAAQKDTVLRRLLQVVVVLTGTPLLQFIPHGVANVLGITPNFAVANTDELSFIAQWEIA